MPARREAPAGLCTRPPPAPGWCPTWRNEGGGGGGGGAYRRAACICRRYKTQGDVVMRGEISAGSQSVSLQFMSSGVQGE